MSEEFKMWLIGISVVFVFAVLLYIIASVVSPQHHISLFESWGLVLTAVVLTTGLQGYNN